MKLKDLMEKYGEYEVNSKCVVGECEIERIVIDLTKPKPKSVWDLEHGEEYVRITGTGGVSECEVCTKITYDRQRDVGNVFLTKEEAEKDIERRKVEALLLKCGGRRWFNCDITNWAIRYNHIQSSFEYGYASVTQYPSCIYFDTEEQAENAVKEIGADRIRDALFEVR